MSNRKETVKRVIDGDTFLTKSRKHPVRLANVNAPEKGKPGSVKATQALKNLIQGEQVQIKTVARDSYGRSVANVKVGSKSVNRAMNQKLNK
jgi:micrococcal nuclease